MFILVPFRSAFCAPEVPDESYVDAGIDLRSSMTDLFKADTLECVGYGDLSLAFLAALRLGILVSTEALKGFACALCGGSGLELAGLGVSSVVRSRTGSFSFTTSLTSLTLLSPLTISTGGFAGIFTVVFPLLSYRSALLNLLAFLFSD